MMYHLARSDDRESIMREGLRAPVYLMPEIPDVIGCDPEADIWEVDTAGYELIPDPSNDDWEEYTGQIALICKRPIPCARISQAAI